MNRQAATSKGLQRRVRDLGFGQVADPRQARKVTLPLPTLLTALVTAMVTKARSLRAVEQRTAQLVRRLGNWLGVSRRIADNTFGKILPRVPLGDLVACIHRLVKAEQRRGNLKPTRLAAGAVAIDGKNSATLRWHDLCRVLDLDETSTTAAEVKARLQAAYPAAQFCQPQDGQPYALMRVHTVTLISAEAAPCIHLRPIEGATNELGAMPALLADLKQGYGRTGLFHLLTTDAGNTSCGLMGQVRGYGWHYCARDQERAWGHLQGSRARPRSTAASGSRGQLHRYRERRALHLSSLELRPGGCGLARLDARAPAAARRAHRREAADRRAHRRQSLLRRQSHARRFRVQGGAFYHPCPLALRAGDALDRRRRAGRGPPPPGVVTPSGRRAGGYGHPHDGARHPRRGPEAESSRLHARDAHLASGGRALSALALWKRAGDCGLRRRLTLPAPALARSTSLPSRCPLGAGAPAHPAVVPRCVLRRLRTRRRRRYAVPDRSWL